VLGRDDRVQDAGRLDQGVVLDVPRSAAHQRLESPPAYVEIRGGELAGVDDVEIPRPKIFGAAASGSTLERGTSGEDDRDPIRRQ
jgi:hypothetical protein